VLVKCHEATNRLLEEIINLIFNTCLSQNDFAGLTALACVNKHWNTHANLFEESYNLKEHCPSNLTILDLKEQGYNSDLEPRINSFAVLKCFQELAPYVENDAGLTLLTSHSTLNELVALATKERSVDWDEESYIDDAVAQKLGDAPVELSVSLITNNVFKGSRNKSYGVRKKLAEAHGCEIPTAQEYFALSIYADICNMPSRERLYPDCAISSTHVDGCPLLFEYSTRDNDGIIIDDTAILLEISRDDNDIKINEEPIGAGGKRTFSPKAPSISGASTAGVDALSNLNTLNNH
jgi:hypothetical protein